MSDTDKLDSGNSSEIAELRDQVNSLQSTLSLALVLTFIFTVAINIFLFHYVRLTRGEANNVQKIADQYRGGEQAGVLELWNKLRAYSATHPDYAPIMNKYSQYIIVHSNAPAAAPPKK